MYFNNFGVFFVVMEKIKQQLLMVFIFAVTLIVFSGCSHLTNELGSISRTTKLSHGMSTTEVVALLGNPSSSEFISDKLIWNYSLHQPWKGWVPYHLVFNKESLKLESWYANEEEYYRQQQLWLQAFPPSQKYDVDLKIK